MSYDEAMSRLERITALLNTNISFEEGAKLFAEGVDLVKLCADELTKRKGEVYEIQRNAEAQLRSIPFATEDE